MKIIVLGSTGMAGRYISSYLKQYFKVVELNRNHFDALNVDINYFNKIINQNDVVINCVGILKPYIDNVGITETHIINTTFPIILNNICKHNDARFIHICSDCVFKGDKGNYSEVDKCDATDVYAITKKRVKIGTIIRTSFIGNDLNDDGVGLMKWVINNQNNTIDGYINCLWNGITALELAKQIYKIILHENFWIGTRHIFSPKIISKYELCNLINTAYNLNIKVNKLNAQNIEGTVIEKCLDRSLCSIHKRMVERSFETQLIEMKKFDDEYSK